MHEQFRVYKHENENAQDSVPMLKDIVVKISCLDLAKKFEVDLKIVDALLDAGAKEAQKKDEDSENVHED